jgi:hypothetical protein
MKLSEANELVLPLLTGAFTAYSHSPAAPVEEATREFLPFSLPHSRLYGDIP